MLLSGLNALNYVAKPTIGSSETTYIIRRGSLGNLARSQDDDQKDYEKAKKSVVDGIMPMAFTSLEEFHHCKLQPGESLSVYVHNLKVLIECTMPGIDATFRGQLLLHQFLAAIPLHVSQQLQAMGNTTNLHPQVVKKACSLMAIEKQPDNATMQSKKVL